MRLKASIHSILAAAFFLLAGAASAQGPGRNTPPPQSGGQEQQPSGGPGFGPRRTGPGAFGPGAVQPGMMQMMGGPAGAGPLQKVSRLMAALDDPRVRTMLGLTDQQADSLRKIVVDTETFTIKTGAVIAVDSIELRELLRADKPDRAAVMAKGNEISKSTSELIAHYLDAMLSAKTILTPEQQKMFRGYMDHDGPGVQPPSARP